MTTIKSCRVRKETVERRDPEVSRDRRVSEDRTDTMECLGPREVSGPPQCLPTKLTTSTTVLCTATRQDTRWDHSISPPKSALPDPADLADFRVPTVSRE